MTKAPTINAPTISDNALFVRVQAVALARQCWRDTSGGVDARALGADARLQRGAGGGTGRRVDVGAEDAEGEGFAAAAEEGGRGESADRGVGVHGAAAAALGGGGEGEDRGIVGEEVVGRGGVVGCGVAAAAHRWDEVGGEGGWGWGGRELVSEVRGVGTLGVAVVWLVWSPESCSGGVDGCEGCG